MPLSTPRSGQRRRSSALQTARDLAHRYALAAWVAVAFVLAGRLAPRFWPEIRSQLARPAVCASEPPFRDLAGAVAETQTILLVTDRSADGSAESLFCAQFELAPRPVIRRHASMFDPSWSPTAAVVLEIDRPELLAGLLSERRQVIEREGHKVHLVAADSRTLLLTIENGAR